MGKGRARREVMGPQLALEKFGRAKGRTLILGFGHLYMNVQPWQIGILLT